MKELLLMRHAKSSWKDDKLSDHERPLNKRGRLAAPRMGEWLRSQGFSPDHALCSTAQRARQTLDAVLEASGWTCPVHYSRELYFSGPRAYRSLLAELEDSCQLALVVGHNPDLEELLEDLTGVEETMPTAAVAWVALEIDRWKQIRKGGGAARGKLRRLWIPRELEQ